MNKKQAVLKLSTSALAVLLASCGGGEGYYGDTDNGNNGNNGNGENTSTPEISSTVESLSISLQDISGNPLVQAIDNSSVKIAIQALNADKGGVAQKQIRLSISDPEQLGVTSATSVVTTIENGIAVFDLNIPKLLGSSAKLQLTAIVDGTSIKQIYTLNIKKTSTIQSDYLINIDQGVVLNLPKGEVSLYATVNDNKGGAKANQSVSLTLPVEMQGKFSITTGSVAQTNSEGKALFTIKASDSLTAADIAEFVGKSQTLNFLLVDENQAERTAAASITFKDVSQIVNTLSIIKPDQAIAAQGGQAEISVLAKNSSGVILANKEISLALEGNASAYGVKLNNLTAITNAQGLAKFTLTTQATHPIALSQEGIQLKATYTDAALLVHGVAKLDVKTTNTDTSDLDAIQRLEIATSYKINAKDDSIIVRVKAINNEGEAAKKGKIKLALNTEATSNGVVFEGEVEKSLKDGFVAYTIKTTAKTQTAVDALIKAGITATFTTDNAVSNSIKITVEDEEKSEEQVGYLSIDPINSAFDYSKDQMITVKVKAVGEDGSALKGEKISLALSAIALKDLPILGFSLTGQASKSTDEAGYAEFTYQYKANNSDRQKELVLNGIALTAKSSNDKVQNVKINFKAPTAQGEIDLDYLTLSMPGNLVLQAGTSQTVIVTVDAKATDAAVLANQKVAIGLSDAALGNGVSLISSSAGNTNENGQITFTLDVNASNTTELNNLIANGITIAVKATRKDGSAYTLTRKIDVSQPIIVLPDLAGLSLSYDVQTVSVLGGEVQVKVVAKDADGNTIANTPLAIALSGLAGSRVSLSDSSLVTNSKGEAEFMVKVSEGTYDANLIKNGITFAIIGTNLNNGDRIQQTGTIQIAIPKDSVNLRLTANQSNVEFGKTYEIKVAVKDELGANTAYPVNLLLNREALDAGIKFSSDSILTSTNAVASISLIIPKDISDAAKQALLNSGIKITGSITNPKGEALKTVLHFNVFEAVNLNHLEITSSINNLSVKGDKSIVTVKLLDLNNQPIRNQEVSLSANNSASLIIGTPGGGHPTNTSEPQKVITDSNGNAFFSVEIDGTTVDAELLIASGIELTASQIDTAGAITTQIHRLSAYKPLPVVAPQPQPARYSLRIASTKPALNVRNDITDVTVTLVDQNGGGVSDQYVTLAIENFILNGAVIVGPSGLTTNQNGQAIFKVKVDETTRNAQYSAVNFDNDNLNLTAKFSETGYVDAQQISRIDIVQAAVQNPKASIVIGVNPTEVISSNDGVYYTRNLSVSVVDFDGKPLARQKVEMDITPLTYLKGRYLWALAPVMGEDPKAKWVAAGTNYYDLSNPNIYLSNGIPMNNSGTPDDMSDDFIVPTKFNPLQQCEVSPTGTAITNSEVSNIPVKVPTFLGQGATATYTTDDEGKFDFTIRYPKIYAQWLNVQIGASSQVATLPFRTTYNLGLPALSSDYSADGTYGPNLNSPYGINTTNCP